MRIGYIIIWTTLLAFLLVSCGENNHLTPPVVDDESLLFGSPATLDWLPGILRPSP